MSPCCTALLCGLLLATSNARRGWGHVDLGADVPFNEGIELAMTLGVQAQVGSCMEAKLQKPGFMGLFDFSTEKRDIVHTMWQIEVNRTTRTLLKHSLFGSIKQKLLELIGVEEEGPQWAQPTKEQEAYQEKRLAALKRLLKSKHDIDYDTLKQPCDVIVSRRLNNTANMVEREFSNGCQGKCTIGHIIDNAQCSESTPGAYCPEGTRCGCQFQPRQKLIETVTSLAVGVYSTFKGVTGAAHLDPMAALALPVGYLATFVASSRMYGCRCLPSPCTWHKRQKVCAPATARTAKNKYNDVMPYVGLKCIAKDHVPSDWWNNPDFNPGCHEAQPCKLEDARKIGRIGYDTFNCQYTAGTGGSVLFPPLRDRYRAYERDPVRIYGLPF